MNLRDYLKSIPPEEIEKRNAEQLKENEEFYKDFKAAYEKGCCSLCGNKLTFFDKTEECFHWFLYPPGIRKKDFIAYLKQPIGYSRLESYFRWVATLENPLKSINDLSDEVSKSKIREVTIQYKNIEWSLTFGPTDLAGHSGSQNADFPHFHIQMLVNKLPFIVFNDFHIPFSKEDLFDFQLMEEAKDLVDFRHDFGEGMSLIENPEYLKELEKVVTVASDEETALLHTTTIVQRPDGKTISGSVLQEIFEESKKTKIPARQLILKYYPDAKVITTVSPGKGVPEMKKRNKR